MELSLVNSDVNSLGSFFYGGPEIPPKARIKWSCLFFKSIIENQFFFSSSKLFALIFRNKVKWFSTQQNFMLGNSYLHSGLFMVIERVVFTTIHGKSGVLNNLAIKSRIIDRLCSKSHGFWIIKWQKYDCKETRLYLNIAQDCEQFKATQGYTRQLMRQIRPRKKS